MLTNLNKAADMGLREHEEDTVPPNNHGRGRCRQAQVIPKRNRVHGPVKAGSKEALQDGRPEWLS